jgi:hypothetical protein
MKRTYDWSSVDWTQPDSKIAKQLGCSRVAVHSRRKAYEIDPPLKQRKPKPITRKEWVQRARVVLEWLATECPEMDAHEIEQQVDAMTEEARKLTQKP